VKVLLIAALMGFAVPAYACYTPPPAQRTHADELIARTRQIVLARVVAAEMAVDANSVSYQFKALRTLKGTEPENIRIVGFPGLWEGDIERFNDHADPLFWENRVGRSQNDTDCQIHPAFSVGGTYLLFLDEPYHVKSFEMILKTGGGADVRDKWLQYVEKRVGVRLK
jgi:hypothetical protein